MFERLVLFLLRGVGGGAATRRDGQNLEELTLAAPSSISAVVIVDQLSKEASLYVMSILIVYFTSIGRRSSVCMLHM